MKTFLVILGTIAITLAAAWGGNAWWKKRQAKAATEVLAVRLEKVRRGDLAEVVQAPGEVQPRT